ncbi:hypothetical protein Tco_0922847 [Tanacetum coccineum]|uniref:Uncharacterized protein n=1 Tax=Tanacetum coccineum TaxID=301880 RepID=A0ABQ5D2L7_9ASTR
MKEKQIVQPDSHSCNVSAKQLPIVPSETKDRSLRVSDSSSKNSGDALVRLNHTSKTATDYDAFARYSELCVRNVTPRPYVFDKYYELCTRNITTRAVVNEDTLCGDVSASNQLKRTHYDTPETDAFEKYSQLYTSLGASSSSSHLKRTCCETQSLLLMVSQPSSFGNAVNQARIS